MANRVPALIAFNVSSEGLLAYSQTLSLQGNALDVTMLAKESYLIVSIDNVHRPWSITDVHEASPDSAELVQCFHLENKDGLPLWRGDEDIPWLKRVRHEGSFEMSEETAYHSLSNLLYTTENLRKRNWE